MPIQIPEQPKVKTTIYDNFKGVDYTNDQTNVWRKRSPSGVNMLPDASGRPFKRTGWEIVKSEDDFISCLSDNGITVETVKISKCFYFELAGIDHIIIFTNRGVFNYSNNGGEIFELLTNSVDCYMSYDRAFFFEGDGKSAFYIYGNQRMWCYDFENGFYEITKDIYIPRVIIGASADCTGTTLEGYNLVGKFAIAEYQENTLNTYFGSDNLMFKVDMENAPSGCNTYTYSSGSWNPSLHSSVTLLSTPQENDKIQIIKGYGVIIPSNVSQGQLADVKVYGTDGTQFNKEYSVVAEGTTPSANTCSLHTDYTGREHPMAWIMFDSHLETQSSEDIIRVIFPSTEIVVTPVSASESTGNAELIR